VFGKNPKGYIIFTDEGRMMAYLEDFKAVRTSKAFGPDLTLADAECARAKVVKELPEVLGRVVGYKAAFTNPAPHARFGVKGPAWGVMFEKGMVDSGAKVPARFGARPLSESDFTAVVKDAGLADARTPLEALEHLSAVVPFIELPDLMVEGQFTGAQLIAANVGFRGGVLGPRVTVEPTQAFLDSLANMTVVMTEDRSGKEISRGKGSALMDNPINAAMWLARTLKEQGIALKPGDLLSLGGYAIAPTQPGTTITVKYVGLPGDPSVTVHFE
jgi:2-keto-4-pentenoate hydratase